MSLSLNSRINTATRFSLVSNSSRLQGDILKFIRQRHFEQGERLFSEREFAEKFSTTRAAVREAITALEALRVVQRRPKSGIFLRDMSADSSIDALVLEVHAGLTMQAKETEDSNEVRRILEVEAARAAATRRNQDDLDKIRQILEASEKRLTEEESINLEDEKFHKAIIASTSNTLLLRVVNWYYELTKYHRVHYFTDMERSRISHSEHLKIFDSLERGDPDECASRMYKHLSHISRLWNAIIEDDIKRERG